MGHLDVVEMKVVAVENIELMKEEKCPYGADKCAFATPKSKRRLVA